MRRWRNKLIVALVALGVGLGVATAQPARANDIRIFTTYVDCSSGDPAISGVFRIYVRWLRDFTPNPDKVRPVFVTFQNRFEHTVEVQQVNHYSQAGVTTWWSGNDVVLASPGAGAAQYGTVWYNPNGPSNVPPTQAELDYVNALPYVGGTFGTGGTDNHMRRPNTTMNNQVVADFGPVNQPWWVPLRNDGPYFLATIKLQGDITTCAGWYPP